MLNLNAKVPCAGCGKLRSTNYDAYEMVNVEVAFDAVVKVCAGRGHGGASDDCVRRARYGVCPGCGARDDRVAARGATQSPSGWEGVEFVSDLAQQVFCGMCKRDLARGRVAAAANPEKRWTPVSTSQFIGGNLPGSNDCASALVKALVRFSCGRTERADGEAIGTPFPIVPAVKGNAYNRPYINVEVELTEGQYAALGEIQKILGEMVESVRRDAFSRGDDLLGQLAAGKKTVAEYDEISRKGRGGV